MARTKRTPAAAADAVRLVAEIASLRASIKLTIQ